MRSGNKIMLTGYNTDVKHEGIIYHVQTEDGGTENPFIVSLIYQGGRILASRKTSYGHLLGTENLISRLRDLLENQHKAMIKSILTGTKVPESGAPGTPSPPGMPSSSPSVPGAGQSPAQPASRAPQAGVREKIEQPEDNSKQPLEVPIEGEAGAPADSAAEKNLDQVILEYLASEIDKD